MPTRPCFEVGRDDFHDNSTYYLYMRAAQPILVGAIVIFAACSGPRSIDGARLPRALHDRAEHYEIIKATAGFEVPGATLWRLTSKNAGNDREADVFVVAVTGDDQILEGQALFLRLLRPGLTADEILERAVSVLVPAPGAIDIKVSNPENFNREELALVRPPRIDSEHLEYWSPGAGMAYGIISRVRIDLKTGQVERKSAGELVRASKAKASATQLSAEALVGSWKTVGGLDFEEITFEADGTYGTFLHARPFESGRWKLEGSDVVLIRDGSPPSRWLQITREGSTLRASTQESKVELTRIP